jgi:hypothetical protein
MFGKKNFTNTQIKGRITNPNDDIYTNTDNNNITLYAKYKKGDGHLSNKSTMTFRDTLSNISILQSPNGLLDTNEGLLSNENNLKESLILWYDNLVNASSGYITDKSGSNNTGTLTSIVTNNTTTDNSIYFDGINDYIKSSSSVISSGSNITISAWIKPSEYVSSTQFIVGQVDTTADNTLDTTQDFKLTIEEDNIIKFTIYSDSTNSSITSNKTLIINEWNYVTAIYDNTNMYLYINSVLNISGSSTLTLSSNETFNVGIGTTSESKFKGYIKDIRLYNRDININEIVELYNKSLIIQNEIINLPIPNVYLKMREGVSTGTIINYGTNNITVNIQHGASTWFNYIDDKNCMVFDGTDDYLTFESSEDFSGQLTISCWVWISGTGSHTIIGNGYNQNFELTYFHSDGNIQYNNDISGGSFTLFNGNTSSFDSYKINTINMLNFELNKWAHIVITRNTGSGKKNVKFYYNNIPYSMYKYTGGGSGDGTITVSSNDNTYDIGKRVGGSNYMEGYINNIRVYNQELTYEQISKIYKLELNENIDIQLNKTNNLKTITNLQEPDTVLSTNNSLLVNLTGQDSSTYTYVADYSLNRFNATLTSGSLSYNSSNAAEISATTTIQFDGSSYLSFDGRKNNSIELKELNYNELSFSCWLYLYDLTNEQAIISTDLNFNIIYNIFVDTNGRINVEYNNNVNNTLIFNEVLSISTWYNLVIIFDNGELKCFIGTTGNEPVNVGLYNIENNARIGTLIRETETLQIGRGELLKTNPTSNIYLKGEIDDIKIYSKALTPNEISTNWNTGSVNYFSSNNNSTDLLINLDGEPGFYSNTEEIYSLLEIKFNETKGTTINDSGDYNNGTLIGGLWTNEAPNNYNTSIYFDGTDDYIDISNNVSYDLSGALSFACWIKPVDGNIGNICSKNFKKEIEIKLDLTNYELVIWNGNGTNFETWKLYNMDSKLDLNDWNFIVITRNNGSTSKNIKFYVNNIEYSPNLVPSTKYTITTGTENINIGRRLIVDSLYFNGHISYLRIYNTELTNTEINNLYEYTFNNLSVVKNTYSTIDSGLSLTYSGVGSTSFNNIDTSMPLYLKLNEGVETTAYDKGTYNNGSIVGCTWAQKNNINNDNSIYFDGSDDYILISNNSSHSLNGELSISLWIKLDNLNSGQTFFSKNYVGEFELSMFTSTIVFFDGNGTSFNNYEINKTDIGIQAGVWYHLVITRNQGNAIGKVVRLYINGRRYTMNTDDNNDYNVQTSANNINIGKRTGGSNYTNGYISQFRIYNYELKYTEVLDLYNYTEGWNSKSKYGNFTYDLNSVRELTVTTDETASTYAGELWFNTSKTMQQIVLKSDYTTRANGDIKLELVSADSNNSNLMTCWNLFAEDLVNGELKDYSGNGNEITIVNGFTNSNKLEGINYNNTLIKFNELSSEDISKTITTGNYLYDNFNTNEFTITCWIYNINGSSNNGIFTLSENTGSSPVNSDKIIHILILDATNAIRFQTNNNSNIIDSFDTTYTISNQTWTHLAFVYDNTDTTSYKRIYANGIDITNGTSSPNIKSLSTNVNVNIGKGYTTNNNLFKGGLTDLRFYNKALSQTEIQEIMQQNMKPELSIQLGGSIFSISNNDAIISPNTWNHLAFNYNSSQEYIELFMNGDKIAQTTSLTNTTNINSNIVLGAQSFEGQINNFSAYSRNLTHNEIKHIYLGFDRLKIHLTGKNQTNNNFTSNVIPYNLSNKSLYNTYFKPYGSGLTLISKDGYFNNILSFDGSTSYIELDPESDLWRNRNFTITMWIKPDSTGSGTNQHIFSRYLSSSYQSYYIAYDYSNEELNIAISSISSVITKSISVLPDIYTHIALIVSNKLVTVYINGSVYINYILPDILNINIDPTLKTVIGDSSDLSNKYKGYIYDFRYYDTSLSIDLISSIYLGYDLNNTENTKPVIDYLSTDLTTVRNKDFVQPAKSSLLLHLNNYTTGSIIASSSENALNATATSMVSSTNDFEFNGSSSYLTISNDSDLNITGTTITISMWIYPDTLTGPDILLIKEFSGNATSSSNNDYAIYINSSNKVVFKLTSTTLTSGTSISTTEWQHITAVYNGSSMLIYINGELENGNTSYSLAIANASSGDVIIGANSVVGELFNGKMRDIRIYNSALSDDDIKLIYNAGLLTSDNYSIAANKKVDNANKYVFISKYLIDNNNETSDILGKISRDSLAVHYNNSNIATTLSDISNDSIPDKMTSLRPKYLDTNKLIEYPINNAIMSTTNLISVNSGIINSNALVFDGNTTSNLVITDGANIMVKDWTFSTWYKITDYTNKNLFLSRKETNKNFDIFIDNTDNILKYKYNTTTVSSNLVIDTLDNDWHHLTITKGQKGLESNIISFYNDGSLVIQRNTDLALTTSATELIVGTDNIDGFTGYLDDIRIYSSCLNSVEIASLSAKRNIGGPVHYWLMEDDTSETTVLDVGSSGNNLCLKGTGTSWDTSNIKYGTRSLKFEGTTSNYASSSATGVLGNCGRSIGMWIKRITSEDEVSDQELISYGNSGTAGEQFSIVINTSSNIQVNIGSTSNIRATTRLNDTDWHHVTVIKLSADAYYNDDRSIKVFIDGNECTDTTTYTQTEINTKITTENDLLQIGKGFKGYINEALVYNYSLSAPELDLIYANKNHYMLNLN